MCLIKKAKYELDQDVLWQHVKLDNSYSTIHIQNFRNLYNFRFVGWLPATRDTNIGSQNNPPKIRIKPNLSLYSLYYAEAC